MYGAILLSQGTSEICSLLRHAPENRSSPWVESGKEKTYKLKEKLQGSINKAWITPQIKATKKSHELRLANHGQNARNQNTRI